MKHFEKNRRDTFVKKEEMREHRKRSVSYSIISMAGYVTAAPAYVRSNLAHGRRAVLFDFQKITKPAAS